MTYFNVRRECCSQRLSIQPATVFMLDIAWVEPLREVYQATRGDFVVGLKYVVRLCHIHYERL